MEKQPAIPVLDLGPQVQALWAEFNGAFQQVLRSGQFILGPQEQQFEREAASFLGARHAIGLNSGTDALHFALLALGLGPGDEVITTPFSFFATAEAIEHVGARPVFVDVDPATFNLDPGQVEGALTARTRAIIPVHLFGRPCAMDRLLALANAHGLTLVEDCAQSFGASWSGRMTGTLGAFGCFSFFPTKNLGAFGDGGLLTTEDDELAAQVRMLRAHGSRKKYFNERLGFNSRLDELQAAMLNIKLKHIDNWNSARAAAATRYNLLLAGHPGLVVPEVVPGHTFHQYTVRILGQSRDELQRRLAEEGIGTMVYYPVPIHRLKYYQGTQDKTSCPVAEVLAGEVLSLPLWPEITQETQARVAGALLELLERPV